MANHFREGLKARRPQLGQWLSTGSVTVADMNRDAGWDWCLVDMEHTPNEVAQVHAQLLALAAGPAAALVRPYWNDPVLVKRLLDAGAQSFVFPMIQTPEEAAAAVAATRYPPEGIRGVALSHTSNRYGRDKGYLERISEEIAVVVQIETKEAMDRIEDIAAVPGVDGLFFGPADIGASLGMIGDVERPELWEAIYAAAERVRPMGMPVGTLTGNPARVREALDRGFLFVSCGTDLSLLVKATAAQIAAVRG
ncbi:MAG: aldolase/citrate lyase family protein [Pseudomonadota bacterium]